MTFCKRQLPGVISQSVAGRVEFTATCNTVVFSVVQYDRKEHGREAKGDDTENAVYKLSDPIQDGNQNTVGN